MEVDYVSEWEARRKMAQLNRSNVIPFKSESEYSDDVAWSNELDHLPLLQRRKLLLAGKPQTTSSDDGVVKREQEDSQVVPTGGTLVDASEEGSNGAVNQCLQSGIGSQEVVVSGDCRSQDTEVEENAWMHQARCSEVAGYGGGIEEVETGVCTPTQNPLVPSQTTEVKVECSDNNIQSSLRDSTTDSAGGAVQAIEFKNNIADDFADELDHIVLRERQRMLLPRKMLRLEKPNLEGLHMELNSCGKQDSVPASTNTMASSSHASSIKVKAEPLDTNESLNSNGISVANSSVNNLTVKTEPEIPNKYYVDELDHMQLQDRIKMRRKGKTPSLKISGNLECLQKCSPSIVEYGSAVPEASDPLRFFRPRKRKKTATDSVQTALEEDAPGLLQVLVEQGVPLEEIKLYGEEDDDEAIDESYIEDGFGELEAVMSKLLLQHSAFIKFAPIRCPKGTKPSYCLGCLFSLVEQTRYLHFRNWPAEWGWCRDLQSFVFVFAKHNRIVLERPEYGFATYFFELVDSISVDWQVKRLMIAMKLTNCGRISIIENRPLLVGEDVTEGEAKVLMQYGWTPNSGLGTMLNYCDRVFHDRKNEKEISEWRSKIGKLLMNGFNGGSIISNNIQAELMQNTSAESPQVKMEL